MGKHSGSGWLLPIARPLARAGRGLWYRYRLGRGEAAGDFTYVWSVWQPPADWVVEVRLPAAAAAPEEAARWCRRQTLRQLRVVGFRDASRGDAGEVSWRADRDGPVAAGDGGGEVPWFCAPGKLAELDPAHLEASLLVMAAEEIDAVVLREAGDPRAAGPESAAEVTAKEWRGLALFSSSSYAYDAAGDGVRPLRDGLLIKVIGPGGAAETPRSRRTFNRHRRGPYLASRPLSSRLEVRVRDAALLRRRPPAADRQPASKPALLVLTSFLARGGAEHTLFETLRVLRDRFALSIATLAPHRPELDDRRPDFRRLSPRLYSLGDQIHPAAMPGVLGSLLDATGAEIVYNANGTTLFYDFAPRLKAERPELRIIDHLYDHRIGYVDRYDRKLLESVDACVAENAKIAEVLVGERGWPRERVPVVRPCGRPRSAFPSGAGERAVRRRLRRELDLADDDLVILTAARMHPQKRPLDLVALAERVRDLEAVRFLIAGGGELEAEVDAAIVAGAGRIRRLPFRSDIPELIVAADVGCLVSDYEGLPVFLLECLQAGRPFLGTDVGELGEVLRSTGAGLVVDRPGDLDALERQVRRLADPAVRSELAERAREAGRGFDVETCAERYAAVFLGEPPPVDG